METIASVVSVAKLLVPITSATWFVLSIMLFLFILFSYSHRRKERGKVGINWEDLIIDPEINRVSPYKVGYLIGVVVSTWIVISLADEKMISFDIMGLYLSYLLGGAGWNEFVQRRLGSANTPNPPTPGNHPPRNSRPNYYPTKSDSGLTKNEYGDFVITDSRPEDYPRN